jgi:hypothetical protein
MQETAWAGPEGILAMICYRDMTFCPFWEDCRDNYECERALNNYVLMRAYEWWGGPGAPICRFSEKPDCWRAKIAE